MKLIEIEKHLNKVLNIKNFKNDSSLNGIQVGASEGKEVKKVAFAVDACYESIKEASSWGADLLIVHHGLFWGTPLAIRDTHYNRVKTLLDNDIALYACHLPLDAHPVFGNNAQMAIQLGLKEYDMFGDYKGMTIGIKGKLDKAVTCEEIAASLGFSPLYGLKILPFGKEEVKTIGIISGGAAYDVSQAIEEELDCYITGETTHGVYHTVKENKINMISGGHYQSEIFGVLAISRMLKAEFDLEVKFFDVRTAL